MNSIMKYMLVAAVALFAAGNFSSCTNTVPDEKTPVQACGHSVVFNMDGTMTLTIGVEIPGMATATTRAMDDAPDYASLDLYLLLFEDGEGLRQYAKALPRASQGDATHGHTELVEFDIALEPTDKNAVVHLVATNQPGFENQIAYGSEDYVIPLLFTDSGCEAYWQRIDLGMPVPGAEAADAASKADAIAEKLGHVPMIRNFCRVSVELNSKITDDTFKLTGVYVVNTVDRGSIAPYVADTKRFVDYYKEQSGKYLCKTYGEISGQGHIGTLPSGIKLINKLDEPIQTKSEGAGGKWEVYFYERPARTSSTERTYVIIEGNYNKSSESSYYKLDLGYTNLDGTDDVVGEFVYYNLLRNFDYVVRLNTIASEGYGSLEAAAAGAVFNNFSASVEARNMNSVSDGTDMIFVNSTSFVFTFPDRPIELLTQFRENINVGGGTVANGKLNIKIMPGDVIAAISDPVDTVINGSTWRKYFVSPLANPDGLLKQQTVYVYRGLNDDGTNGLYREITFFSHGPWSFEHIDTFPGHWETVDDMPDGWEWTINKNREIGHLKGSPLTLFFELPAGLPQAIFPLKFLIESDRQNIQNAYQGNAVVRSVPAGESLFAKDWTLSTGAPTTTRIQYEKTVTWEDYYGGVSDELIGTGSSIVRCRFLTITDLNQDVIGNGEDHGMSKTTLRVYNPYFGTYTKDGMWLGYVDDGFDRDKNTSDPSPRFWDFSSGIWNSIMYRMNDKERGKLTEDNNLTDELYFIEGGTRTLSNVQEDAFRYVLASNDGDILRHKHTYSTTPRTIRLEVMSTDNQGTPSEPRIQISITGGTGTAMLSYSTFTDGMYIYEYEIPEFVKSLDLDIMRPIGKPMRFYRVDFYPRWGDFNEIPEGTPAD